MKRYFFTEQDLEDLKRLYTKARDETRQWPNSFGHGFNAGRLEALMDLEEFVIVSHDNP